MLEYGNLSLGDYSTLESTDGSTAIQVVIGSPTYCGRDRELWEPERGAD